MKTILHLAPVLAALASSTLAAPLRPPLPGFDALDAPAPLRNPMAVAPVVPGATVRLDERVGLPSFITFDRRAAAPAAQKARWGAMDPEAAARAQLHSLLPAYKLSPAELSRSSARVVHDLGTGPILVRFQQSVDGVPVLGKGLTVLLDGDRRMVASSGHLSPHAEEARAMELRFALSPQEAASRALADVGQVAVDAQAWEDLRSRQGDRDLYALAGDTGIRLDRPTAIQRVLYPLAEGLEPAYWILISEPGGEGRYSYVISARDGQLLFRNSLVASETVVPVTYTVWGDASGLPFDGPEGDVTPAPAGAFDGGHPAKVARNQVTLGNLGLAEFSRAATDPWLPAATTTTNGNNVRAYVDRGPSDGYDAPEGDAYAAMTGASAFDYPYSFATDPRDANELNAGIVELFYLNNVVHDVFYDRGFDEASGNAQAQNYGRGGFEGDPIRAEAQDFSGTDNANMMTPPDGESPRMQMFVWTGLPEVGLEIRTPATADPLLSVGHSIFNPVPFDVIAAVARALDLGGNGIGPGYTGCNAFAAGTFTGKLALIDRGSPAGFTGGTDGACTFELKVLNAQNAGAVGVIIANVATSPDPDRRVRMLGDERDTHTPAIHVALADGDRLRTFVAGGNLIVRIYRRPSWDRDGALDALVVVHEWGHYMVGRLVGPLAQAQGGAMNEGWADFVAMLMAVKASDPLSYAGAYPVGTYAGSGAANGPLVDRTYYFGIRRVPYSIDFAINPLTFGHIAQNAVLPDGVPYAFQSDNNEIHNAGEVWATVLWEAYAGLLREGRLTFEQARDRMMRYLVASLKLTPSNPTMLDARDALLATVEASDLADYLVVRAAFVRRGFGANAVAPPSASTALTGLRESFAWSDLRYQSATLADDVTQVVADGTLDDGETGTIVLSFSNAGAAAVGGTVTFTSPTPGVTFPQGATATLAPIAAGATGTARIQVALSGAETTLRGEISFSDDAEPSNTDRAPYAALVNTPKLPVVAIAAVPPLKAGEQGTLDGSGTRDPLGTAMTYEWTQTGGPDATIADATSAIARFKAPSVGGKPQTLTFQLQVQNGNGLRSTATTTVTVNPGPCGCGAGAAGPGLAFALLVLERVIRRRRR